MKKTAVVILNWNGADMLRRFLPSVLAHSGDAAEVIVADNASTDASLAVLREEFPQVRTILLDRNYGFAEGYNRALAQVEADYLLLLNSDVEVTPHWIDPLTDYLDRHPDVAACQPKLLQVDADVFEYAGACGGYIDRYGYPFCRGRLMGTTEPDARQYDTVAPTFWATGAALLIRRTDWLAAGGLDGRFFAHMEEIDLCWRLRARGRGVACVPQSVVRHVGGGTLNALSPRKTFLNFRNNLLLLYKNLPDAELRRVMRVRWVLDRVAALKFLLSGQFSHAAAVLRARREFRRLRSDFAPQRAENLAQTMLDPIPEQLPQSLLALYYIKGVRRFSQLKW